LNSMYLKKIKDLSKKARSLADSNQLEEAKKLLPKIYKILDKASKKNTIKKNTASRKKSRISAFLSAKSQK